MKRYILIGMIGIVLLVVFSFGCKGPFISSKRSTTTDIYKGTDGLVVSFLKNSPPKEVFEDSEFQANMLLKNNGVTDINNGILTLTIEQDYMALIEWQPDKDQRPIKKAEKNQAFFDLRGKSITYSDGESGTTSITLRTKLLEKQSTKHDTVLVLTACYPYSTEYTAMVCIDNDPGNFRGIIKPCAIKVITSASQGSPIAITKIDTEMQTHEDSKKMKPHFTIELQNKGNGVVVKAEEEAIAKACSSSNIEEELNIVKVTVRLGNEELECKPDKIRLRDNRASIKCTLEQGIEKSKGTFTSPLSIVLDYGYMSSISSQVTIKR